jgi:hypothetical protein
VKEAKKEQNSLNLITFENHLKLESIFMPDSLKPHIHRSQLPGIPGINSFELYYGSWHLLNQALSCFLHGENYSCLSCLNASIELWLKRKLKSNRKLCSLINQAKRKKLITKEEQEQLHQLRKIRNDYLHFDIKKLPKFKKWGTTLNVKTQQISVVNAYPNDEFYDVNPISFLPVYAYYGLNVLTDFYSKRYPKTGLIGDAYFRFNLTHIEGLNEEKLFFKLGISTRKKSKFRRFLSFVNRMLRLRK